MTLPSTRHPRPRKQSCVYTSITKTKLPPTENRAYSIQYSMENVLVIQEPTKPPVLDQRTPREEDHAQLRKSICLCESIQDFVAVYDSYSFQGALCRIRVAMLCSLPPEVWSEQWAVRMRNPSKADVELNQDRKTSLCLVYRRCVCWNDPLNEMVTETTVAHQFKTRRLVNILQFALPMDRAQAMYAMKYAGTKRHGMHWVSASHVAASPLLAVSLESMNGLPTINRRLVHLMESPIIGLNRIGVFRRWMEPVLKQQLGDGRS